MSEASVRELSPREKAVLRGIQAGRTYAEIACKLGVTYDTVKTLTNRIRAKIGKNSKAALAVWAASNPDRLASARKKRVS